MATTATKATGAALHITLNSRTYRLAPLTDENLAEFRLWGEQRYMELAKRNLDDLDLVHQTELLKHAFDRAVDLDLTGREGMSLMSSPDGAIKLLWLSLLRHQPKVTEEFVRNVLRDEKTLREAMASIERLNKTPATQKKTGTRAQMRPVTRKKKKRR